MLTGLGLGRIEEDVRMVADWETGTADWAWDYVMGLPDWGQSYPWWPVQYDFSGAGWPAPVQALN